MPCERDRLSPIERPIPGELYDTRERGFAQVTVAPAGAQVFTAGIVGYRPDWSLPGDGGFEAQARQALKNLRLALAAAGAGPADVLHLRLYAVGLDEARFSLLAGLLGADFYDPDPTARPATTVVGVAALARPELLVEVEATAVRP